MAEGTELTQTATEPTSAVNPDGTFTEDWAEKYGEENKDHLSRYKNFDALVNSHIATKKKFGRDPNTLVQIPNDDSPDEVKAAFHKAAGKPETAEGYEYKKSPDISPKVEATKDQIKSFSEIAHKWDLSKKQFNGVVNDYLVMIGKDADNYDADITEAEAKATQEGNTVLTKIFREETGTRKVRANAVLDKYGLEVMKMPDGSETTIKGMLFEENPKLLQSPWMIMLLDRFAESMSEDKIKGLSPTIPGSADVKAKIAEVRTRMDVITKENPVNFAANAEYKDLKARKTELYRQIK